MQRSNRVDIYADTDDTGVIGANIEPFAGDVAREYAKQAKASAEAALASENASDESEAAAKASENAAAVSEAAAKASEEAAAASEQAAKISETNAKASETAAAASAQDAHNVAEAVGNPVTSVEENHGQVTVKKADGTQNTFYSGLNILQRNKAYEVGDIATSPLLPSWAYLECTKAGTTGATEPDFSSIKAGGVVNDGTCTFLVVDVKQAGVDVEAVKGDLAEEASAREQGDSEISSKLSSYVPKTVPTAKIKKLTSKVYGEGDITLSESYKNFDVLIFMAADDSQQGICPYLYPVWLFDFAVSFCKSNSNRRFRISGFSYYWDLKVESITNTKLACSTENSSIMAVYGVKYT